MTDAVIFLCDLSGQAAEPWAEAGWDCYCVDVEHSIRRDRVVQHGAGRIHFASPGDDRADFRSKSPRGFWRAMHAANDPRLKDKFAEAAE